MKIVPIEVPGYLIPYVTQEFAGVSIIDEKETYKEIKIEPTSILGMFLTRTIRPDYKVKFYQMILYSKKMNEGIAYSSHIMEYKNNAEFLIDLNFEDLSNFYKFLDTVFHTSFFFYMVGFVSRDKTHGSITAGIEVFIDRYDLLEYGYSVDQLRHLYYAHISKGAINSLKTNKSLSMEKFLHSNF